MAGRFPDATSLEDFWENLARGRDSLHEFDDEELQAAGVPAHLLKDPNYVKRGTFVEGAELFDAAFFGFNPREAAVTDPQQRVFLECAWEALEDAGYVGDRRPEPVGVYAGVGMNTYLIRNVLANPEVMEAVGGYQLMLASEKDYLATRVSYKLNLRGPSLYDPNGLLNVAGGGQPGLRALAGRPLPDGPGGWRVVAVPRQDRIPLYGGNDLLLGRSLSTVRCAGERDARRRRRRNRRVAAPRGRDTRSRLHPGRDPWHSHQQ